MHMNRLGMTVAVLALAMSGCGGGGGKKTVSPSGSGAGTTVKETEYALAPGAIKVARPGTVTLTAHNAGQMVYALQVEGNGSDKKTANIQPGSSAKLTVSLKPGSYQLYC